MTPKRFPVFFARLADPAHKLPVPGHARLFGDGVEGGIERLDARDPFWLACLRDGSIIEADAPDAPGPSPQPSPSPGLTRGSRGEGEAS